MHQTCHQAPCRGNVFIADYVDNVRAELYALVPSVCYTWRWPQTIPNDPPLSYSLLLEGSHLWTPYRTVVPNKTYPLAYHAYSQTV